MIKQLLLLEKLIYAALNKLALCDDVKIMLGVPNKMFNKQTRQNIRTFIRTRLYLLKIRLQTLERQLK